MNEWIVGTLVGVLAGICNSILGFTFDQKGFWVVVMLAIVCRVIGQLEDRGVK